MTQKVILEIRAGAGGDEASLFVGDLVRMYQRYAQKKGWSFAILDSAIGTRGYKTFIGKIVGADAYTELKQESGVHRVQRVPETERSGRVHTSTASVAVMPEVEPTAFVISPNDLEISTFRSSGPGGQNVNKVETAVRIVHKPSGLAVASQNERSQSRNKEEAMSILRSKLYERKIEEEAAKLGAARRELIGTADRSEKIRTYNFPQDRITDHRIGKKWSNIEKILNGDLEPVIQAFTAIKNTTAQTPKEEFHTAG